MFIFIDYYVDNPIMLSQALIAVKHCVKLRSTRSYRSEHNATILSGNDLVTELARDVDILTLFVLKDSPVATRKTHSNIVDSAQRVFAVSEGVMAKICGLESVSQSMMAAEIALPRYARFEAWESRTLRRLLVLDRCQDPGNLGTLLRTSIALGWDGVFLTHGCADPFNEKSIRASRGACFKLPLGHGTVEDWKEVVSQHHFVCIAADLTGQKDNTIENIVGNARGARIEKNVCLVLGSEGQGVSPEFIEESTSVTIPMVGEMESLNVAAAGAILMFALSSEAGKLECLLSSVLQQHSN